MIYDSCDYFVVTKETFLYLFSISCIKMTTQEILDFMLGKQPTSTPSIASATPSNRTSIASSPRRNEQQKKRELVAVAFARTMKDWLETDDTLLQIIQSITNLRERIWETSKRLWKRRLEERDEMQMWLANHGYRKNCCISLTVADLELALDHALLQHERMQASLRKLLSSLSQTQDALGRRLDEYYKLNLEEVTLEEHCYVMLSREECRELFAATAQELFRKQSMAEDLFRSSHNALLYSEDHLKEYRDENSRCVGQLICSKWSRTHGDCYLLEFNQLIQRILR